MIGRSRQYAAARPFRHVVIDDAVPHTLAHAAAAEFPPPDGPWHTFTGPLEQGKQEGDAAIAGPCVAAIHEQLAADWFVGWLRDLTGIRDLVADPFRTGGGIHQSGPGARLGLHVDFNLHPLHADLVRAVNVILFLTGAPGEYTAGGWLHLSAKNETVRVRPREAMLVVFEAGDDTYHGHPIPLADDAQLRKSIPTYYYRPVSDDEDIEPRSTRFLDA